jgi:hypothetical protein
MIGVTDLRGVNQNTIRGHNNHRDIRVLSTLDVRPLEASAGV